MRRFNRIAQTLIGLALATMIAPAPTLTLAQERFSTSAPSARWGKDYLPNLPVIDQDGNTFRFYDDLIAGKNVIINFIFTTCTDICPLTTARMGLVQERLGASVGRDVFMYSISIDPENDRPEQLKNFAEAFRVGPGWRLLTGKPDDIAVIRSKLGERSKVLSEHRHEILLGSSAGGSWSKDSVFGDIERVIRNVKSLDPNWPQEPSTPASNAAAGAGFMEVTAQPGQALFIKACSSCHTIGKGDRIGPDLAHVSGRRSHDWLKSFVSRPDKMFAAKDPVALAMAKKYRGLKMPNLGLSESDAADVIAFIDAQSYIITAQANGTAALHDHSKHHGHEHTHDHKHAPK